LKREYGVLSDILDAEQASIENAQRLEAGLIELGCMASNWIGRAYKGDTPFETPLDIRMVAPANSGAMFFIVEAGSDLQNVRDLVGRRVSIGPQGSGMVQHIHTMFDILGISFNDFEPIYLSFEEGAKALEEGKADAQWQCPFPNAVMRALSERMDVRILDYEPGDLNNIVDNIDFYNRAVMPAGFFRGVQRNTDQLAVVNIIATHSNTDDEIVRKCVAILLENQEELANINPLFLGLSDLFTPLKSSGLSALEFGGVPLHPGAIQAYQDAGYIS